jgi:hypothetical protein
MSPEHESPEAQLAALHPDYPEWDLWLVRVYQPRGITWCARRKGEKYARINTDTPEHLIAEIASDDERNPRRGCPA